MEIVQICAGLEFHITWLVLGFFMAQGICQSNDLSYNDFGKGNELDNEQSQF